MTEPRCPLCHSKGKSAGPDLFKCSKCGGLFDADPDEGGTVSNRNPAARMERAEKQLEQRIGQTRRRTR